MNALRLFQCFFMILSFEAYFYESSFVVIRHFDRHAPIIAVDTARLPLHIYRNIN